MYEEVPVEKAFELHQLPGSQRLQTGSGDVHVVRWSSAAVREGGSPAKTTIVCIHGLSDSSHSFAPWARALIAEAEAGAEGAAVEVVAVDLPGHGLTGPWVPSKSSPGGIGPAPYTRGADVAFIREVLQKLGLARRADPEDAAAGERPHVMLVGHSIGGAIAAAYAASYPADVSGLVLLAPWGLDYRASQPEEYRTASVVLSVALTPCAWPVVSLACIAMRYVTPRWVVQLLVPTAFGRGETVLGPERQREIANRYHAMMLREGNREAIHARIATMVDEERHVEASHETSLRVIKSLSCPVQIQWGLLDEWLPVSRAESWTAALQTRPSHEVDTSSRVQLWPMAGHCLHEQVPCASAQAAFKHITEVVPANV